LGFEPIPQIFWNFNYKKNVLGENPVVAPSFVNYSIFHPSMTPPDIIKTTEYHEIIRKEN
jgi:hypothetical protein